MKIKASRWALIMLGAAGGWLAVTFVVVAIGLRSIATMTIGVGFVCLVAALVFGLVALGSFAKRRHQAAMARVHAAQSRRVG